ncbi:non-ribosomal peptide synthetase [Kitasatospora sp. NPDC088134]|uniref:non-ribosomal peptide synthetase n=1 Tax=Kitasatospora sp. NPDC088134 TaxID=3364071 RepID=UPI00382DA7D9
MSSATLPGRPDREHFECVDAVFRRRVAEHPDKVAARDSTGSSSYAELWDRAVRLAGALRGRGVGTGDAVGILGVGDRDTLVAMLGILLAGGHFVPIDPDCPAERIERMTTIAGAALVLTTSEHRLPAGVGVDSRPVRDLVEQPGPADPLDLLPAGDPDRPAYVIFTSGSTGAPKAVAVPHGALTALCLRPGVLRRDPDETLLVHTVLTFDTAMFEIWGALLVGASVLCAPRRALSLHETADLLRDARVTTAVLTPAVFALLADHHPDALGELRCLMVGGDVMPREQALRVLDRFPELEFLNTYGPTENTVISTAFRLNGWDRQGSSVPIGTALAGATCHVLDERLRPLPPGEVGDLHLGGDRLALGYVGDPAMTEQRFLPDPFSDRPGARMYRTGDRAALRADGTVEFHGREDDELKVRGHRIHLAEVEALLAADPEVREVVATAVGTGHQRHVRAFVRPTAPGVDPLAVRTRLAGRAPQHLVPDELALVDAFPLKPSGKVDREALKALPFPQAPEAAPAVGTDDRAVLARFWLERTGTPAGNGADFFHAGGTSLDLILLIESIAVAFGVRLDFADVYGLRSFEELHDMVLTHRQEVDA